MSDNSSIEWTDATWNPVTGCTKVSQGCKHCYAEREWPRLTKLVPAYAGRDFTDVRTHADRLDQPLHWKKSRRVFVNSMSDLFHESVPFEFIDQVFAVMTLAKQHTFQVLTKRADRMREYLLRRSDEMRSDDWFSGPLARACFSVSKSAGNPLPGNAPLQLAGRWPLPNVWLGVSVEDQATADERIPLLLQTPAAVRWISAEPLLGPVNIGKWLDPWTCSDCCYHGGEADTGPCMCADCNVEAEYSPEIGSGRCPKCGKDDGTSDDVGGTCPQCGSVRGWSRDYGFMFDSEPHAQIHWVVVGGESGPKARPMHPEWARNLRDQCAAAGVPFLFKQWGEWSPGYLEHGNDLTYEQIVDAKQHEWPEGHCAFRVGKRSAGRMLDGVQHDGYPEAKP